MTRIITIAVLAAAIAGIAATAEAQSQRTSPQPRAGRGQLAPNEVVAMLDAYAVVQAQDALQLSEAQYGPFVTRLKKLQETRRRNQQRRNQLLAELRKLTTAAGEEGAIRDRLKALRQHDQQSAAELDAAYAALDEVIDVAQQARFRLFEETLERRKLDLLVRVRQAARRGGIQ